jgi:titin
MQPLICLATIVLFAGASTRSGFGALINNYAGNITVTVSTEDSGNSMLGSDTVNRSGFGGTAPNFTDGDSDGRPEHDATIGNLWRSASGTVSNHFISYNLGTAYTVTNVVVWNFNQSGNQSKGIKDFKLWYSTIASPTPVANPAAPDWTLAGTYTLVNQGTGAAGYDNVDVIALNISARHILFDVETIHAGVTSDRCGLSEVQLYGAAPPPSAPSSLTATKVSSSRIDLSWTDNSSDETGFKIERKTGAGGTYAQIDTLGAGVTTYESTGLSGDTEYYYRVRAYNAGGDSAYSNEDNATTDPGVPSSPSALSLTPVSTSQIDLSWTDNAGNETGFEIQRKTGAAGSYAQIATVGENVTSYQNTGLSTDTEYYYQVRATNAIGASDWCSEAGATTLPDPPTAPGALEATEVSASRIDLAWDDNSGDETGFRIERKTGAAGGWSEIATVAANVESYENTGLDANTEYYYRVRAYNAGGNSGYSDEDCATTLDDRFYVAKHGFNTNSGTKAAPWATIQYAVTNVTSGRTILIGEGTYTENVLLTNTIHTLTIKGGHNTNDWSWDPGQHPTTVKGKVSLGSPLSTSNTVVGLAINANGGYGIEVPYHASAKGKVTVSHCVITNASWGLYSEAGCDFNVYNTVVAKCSQGGSYLNGGAGITGTNYIDNCTFTTNLRANIWIPNGGKTYIRNTIAYGAYKTASEGYGIAAGATEARSAIVSHSLLFANNIITNGMISFGSGMITNQPPVFENYAGDNYRLTADSPGIDDGITITSVTDDLDLNPRPWGTAFHDIGAYERFVATDPPVAPSALSASASAYNQINLSWTDNADNETGFKIERKTGAGAYAQIDTVGENVSSYQDTTVSSDTQYHYRVRAYNPIGDSSYSNEDDATTPPGPPADPSALVLTPVSTSQINLGWTDNAGSETGFEIQRKTGAGAYAQIANVAANVTAYTNTGLATDTLYYYQVRATNAAYQSAFIEASASTWPNPPAAPNGLAATAMSKTRIDLSWTDNASNETGFKIERKTGAGGTYAQIATVGANVQGYTNNTGLTADTTYYYRLCATNTGGASSTIEANATTLDDRRYVAKHGFNTNPGTQSQPWGTIQYAVTNVQSGDRILIGEGTYTENVVLTNTIHSLTIQGGHNTNDWSWDPGNHPTVIKGTTGARIQLGGDSSFNGLPSVSNTIMGLTLIGGLYGVRSPWHGSIMGSVTISHCVITNQGANGWSISANGGCDFTLINTLVGYSDIGLYSPSGAGPSGTNYIFNCTFVTNKRANVWALVGKTVVRNTIVYGAYGAGGANNEGYGIAAGATAANSADVRHSLVYGNTFNTNGLVTFGDGAITNLAPVFVNYAGGNFRPGESSPGVDQGLAIPAVTNDLDLNPRPWGRPFYDMGAYEIYSPPLPSVFRFR